MNERIKQLESSCWEELGEDESHYPVFNTKKFAELVVRECCKEITYASVSNEDSVFAYAYIDHLRNTFGVNKC